MNAEISSTLAYSVDASSEVDPLAYDVSRQLNEQTEYNMLNIPAKVYLLEMEDATFSHNSAVPLLYLPPVQSEPIEWEETGFPDSFFKELQPYFPHLYEIRRDPETYKKIEVQEVERRGLSVLAVAFAFLKDNPSQQLLLCGHTDTSGDDSYNFKLSDLRAEAVYALLVNDRKTWIDIVKSKHNVSDYQSLCYYFSKFYAWSCDPGDIDNNHGQSTTDALRVLQTESNALFGNGIAEDGKIGPQTWGAIFDLYQYDLAEIMETDVEELQQARGSLRWVDDSTPWIGCGERFPIDEPDRNNFRSAENRRLEFLFFHQQFLPVLTEHKSGGSMRKSSAQRFHSPIYSPRYYDRVFLKVNSWGGFPSMGKEGSFEVELDEPEIDEESTEELYEPGPDDVSFPIDDD